MADLQTTPINDENFYVDGQATQGIKNQLMLDTGTEKFWIDGQPVIDLFMKGNADTGKHFLEFE